MYYTYVLKSQVDGRLYKGHCQDLRKRILEHNSRKVFSTKGFIPWELVYFESFETRKEAINREKFLKTGVGREFLKEKIKAA
ncbi:GIY-YIG nuclease family protein [Flavobacteriaceae bacterium XHP0103]|uniref:GIY-YIG nuclease family protein n=1 Tax=Marixanthotalea marina TaxID=2844359 RepID=UPI002989FB54|nr:GIY-YIG nuclease family protein [Marixanthotalea marina]MBU3821078.1 GIY-YIG nuclease family protein [Marixanthotalea marina]